MSHLFHRLHVGKINDYRRCYYYPAEIVTWYAARGLLKEFTGKLCCVKCDDQKGGCYDQCNGCVMG